MTKEKLTSVVGTVVFHLLILLCLLFYYIKPVEIDETEELGGVPVMFGNLYDAYGTDMPEGTVKGLPDGADKEEISNPLLPNHVDSKDKAKEDKAKSKPSDKSSVTDNKVSQTTQDLDKTISATDIAKQKAADAEKKKKEEAAQRASQEAERQRNINNLVKGGFAGGSGSEANNGTTSGSGLQGSPSGNSDKGKLSGVAGLGSYDLGGRGVGSGGLQLPTYAVDEAGRVVVDIIVDSQGNVVEANIGRGTTTANASLRNESIKAAKKTKFKIVSTSNNQRGTITYNFRLN